MFSGNLKLFWELESMSQLIRVCITNHNDIYFFIFAKNRIRKVLNSERIISILTHIRYLFNSFGEVKFLAHKRPGCWDLENQC